MILLTIEVSRQTGQWAPVSLQLCPEKRARAISEKHHHLGPHSLRCSGSGEGTVRMLYVLTYYFCSDCSVCHEKLLSARWRLFMLNGRCGPIGRDRCSHVNCSCFAAAMGQLGSTGAYMSRSLCFATANSASLKAPPECRTQRSFSAVRASRGVFWCVC